ncbi:MAG: DUF3035 domain-containing protein [Alphaproteobacteria bacterium]|nr:DUF3035 domain-containing protein [Alphaproteobacteria bacterium]
MKNLNIVLFMMGALLSVSACSKTQEQFDFSKKAPDEFAVVKRAPLEMPPDYQLRPPRPGAPRPQESATDEKAKQAVFGIEDLQENKQERQPVSVGESILLQKSGVAETKTNIRDIIDQETAEIIKEETPTVDRLLGKVGKEIEAPADVVDPVKETERIIHNSNAGKPVTDGETPTTKQ